MTFVTVVSPIALRSIATVTGGGRLVEVSATVRIVITVKGILMGRRTQILDPGRKPNMKTDLFIFS
jgi:hypothetical protein